MRKLLVGILGLVFGFSLSANAAIFYVSVSGDDNSGDGSQASPWQHIQYGINQSDDLDTVYVMPGTYAEHLDFNGENVSVIGLEGASNTIITRESQDAPLVKYNNGETQDAILQGFTIHNSTSTGIYINSASPHIRECIIENNGASGLSGGGVSIVGGGARPLIRKNIIRNNSVYNGYFGGGIYSSGSYPLIDSNYVFSNQCPGDGGAIFVQGGSITLDHNVIYQNMGSDEGVVVLSAVMDGLISNNTVYNNNVGRYSGGILLGNGSSNIEIKNNIFTENDQYGVYVHSGSENVLISYNCFYNNEAGSIHGYTQGPGNIFYDPLLVDAPNGDFRLTSESPCIDAGDPAFGTDPDGSPIDIGAIFYGTIPPDLAIQILEAYGEQGQNTDVDITVLGFSSIDVSGLEFHISYDDECLEFVSFTSEYLGDALTNVENGTIHIIWEDYETPRSFDEESVLFNLEFTVLADYGTDCAIEWQDNCEIVDEVGQPIAAPVYLDGIVHSTAIRSVSGQLIYYDLVSPIVDADMYIEGEVISNETVSGEDGTYGFNNLISGDYSVTASKVTDDAGITVNDIILIRREIVNLEAFDNPLKFIAADVNKSGFVSIADVIKLRRYLADLEELAEGNWVFVDSTFEVDEMNWFDAPGYRDIAIVEDDIVGISFIGVRLGDVDMSFGGARSSLICLDDSVSINLNTVNCRPGNTVTMPVTTTGFSDVAGVEIHISYPLDAISEVTLNSEVIEPTANAGNGYIHLVWDDIFNPLELDDFDDMLNIDFTVAEGAPDTVEISFTGSYICNEYGDDFIVGLYDGYICTNVTGVDDETSPLPTSYMLSQNYPNPFNAATEIAFELPQQTSVNLVIYDIQGREVVTLLDTDMPAGVHQVNWNATSYPSGIYLYKLTTGEFSEAKKMLLLK